MPAGEGGPVAELTVLGRADLGKPAGTFPHHPRSTEPGTAGDGTRGDKDRPLPSSSSQGVN